MFLKLINPEGLDLSDFCNYLIEEIIEYVDNSSGLDQKIADTWTQHFKSVDLGWVKDISGNPIPPTFEFIISQYFDNLYFYETDGAYFITSDPNTLLNSTNISIESLATMINDGTIGMEAYPYIDQVFNYFAANMQTYFNAYLAGVSSKDLGGE